MPQDRGRLDPYELAVLRGPDGEEADDRPPPLPKLTVGRFKVGPLGLVSGVLLLVVFSAAVRDSGGPPDLPASCTSPALRLGVRAVIEHGPVGYTAVGPDTGPVVLAIDASGLDPAGQPVAEAGGVTQRLGLPRRIQGCRVHGTFGAQVPIGHHTVTMFRVGSAEVLARAPLDVTDRFGSLRPGGSASG